MTRLSIELPEVFPFATELDVRVSDLNYGNHLGNDAVLSLVHEARRRFLAAHGVEEISADGKGFVIADAAVIYRAQAFYGERLRVEVAAGDFQSRGCVFYFRLSKAADGKTVAEAHTGVVCFDFGTQKTMVFPAEMRQRLEGKA